MLKLLPILASLLFTGMLYGQGIVGPTVSPIVWEDDNSGTTTVVNFPTNTAGDLLVAFISESNNPGNFSLGHTSPPGWTMVTSTNNLDPSWPSGLYVAWRVAPVGGLSTETFTAFNSTGYISFGLVFQGVDTLLPIDLISVASPSLTPVSTITAPSASTSTDGALVIWMMAKGGSTASFTNIPGTFNFTGVEMNPGRGTELVWGQFIQPFAEVVASQTFTWINDPQYAVAATMVFNPATPTIPVPPSHITVTAMDYTLQNDSLGIGVTFAVNDPDLDSIYISGPFTHPVLSTVITNLVPPFPLRQVLWYDVATVVDSQIVTGSLASRTFRNGCRSGTVSCGGASTGPLSIPFTWTRINPTQIPSENIAHWYNANSNVVINQIMDKDITPAPMPLCDSLKAVFTYGRPLSFGIIDTITVSVISTNTQGCTLFVPRTRQTSWMFKTYVFNFNTSGVTGLVIPSSPSIVTIDTLP